MLFSLVTAWAHAVGGGRAALEHRLHTEEREQIDTETLKRATSFQS